MAVKELLTRIALKYDTYENWMDAEKGGKLVLLKGEIGLCEIPSAPADGSEHATNAPAVLFKVGDGEKTFSQLNWVSAKAADVYEWAKASDVQVEGKTIKFVGTNKTITFDYITEAEVKTKITNALDARILAIENSIGEGGDVAGQIEDINEALEVLNGTGEGSVSKALSDAKAYTDEREIEINKYADQAETDAIAAAKTYTDAEVKKNKDLIDGLSAADSAQDALISGNTAEISTLKETTIPGVVSAYKAADTAIEEKIGGTYTKDATVHAAIVAAKGAADAAQADVDALTAADGVVTKNTSDIAKNKADIEQLGADLQAEAKTRKDNDDAIIERLESVETFFKLEEGESLNEALDTLKEIQDYLSGEGNATDGIIGRVAQAENDIDSLQADFAAGGRVTKAEADIDALEGDVDAIEGTITGYDSTNTVKKAVDAAQAQADKGVEDAGKAQAAADKAQDEIDALEAIVGDETTGLVQLVNTAKGTADGAAADTADLKPRVKTAEDEIDALQAIVVSGADSNENLREAITSLEELTGDTAANGNAKLRTDIDALAALINGSGDDAGLAARLATAEGKIETVEGKVETAESKIADVEDRIDTIEADYLKAADEFIFQCGSASKAVHVATVTE